MNISWIAGPQEAEQGPHDQDVQVQGSDNKFDLLDSSNL